MKKSLKILSLFLAVIISFCTYAPILTFAATESQLRNKVVAVADNEVGYTGSSTYSKYGEWYGSQGSWCTTFVFWCFDQAGNNYSTKLNGVIIPNGGNCNSMISWFSNKGRYHKSGSGYAPKGGDLIFFDWSGNGSSQHVGIVDYTSGSTVYTIEGNCSGKVKSRSYTSSGSKPYNNISSIMGYASPDYDSVSGGSSDSKENDKNTTKRTSSSNTTTKNNNSNKTTTKKQTTQTEPQSTTSVPVEKLTIHAQSYELQVGDSVKLNYSIEPIGAAAVVGYFCDDEGIIEIDSGGDIKAIGTGTATVVVCANNDLYSQCEFTVKQAVAEVTTIAHETTRKVVGTAKSEVITTQRTAESVLTRMGVNVNSLKQNMQLYLVPTTIIGTTFILSIFIFIVKKIKNRKKKTSEDAENSSIK